MIESISIDQARKLVLQSQKLPPAKQKVSALKATLSAIEHLGYIQIDTISAIARAHHHTLWNRNPLYEIAQLAQLLADKRVFEYWSHAASFLPMKDFRFSLPRKQAMVSGEAKYWYPKDEKLMKYVLDRIKTEGSLMAKDFAHNGKKISAWGSKPAKIALEQLFEQGDLMVLFRKNFHKVYDLTERVLPADLDTKTPTKVEVIRFHILSFLRANGIGQAAEIAYLQTGAKPIVKAILNEMLVGGELIQIKVGENSYYALPESLDLLNKPLSRSKLKILSPFDNLLIQRKRMKTLFNFDYLLECYYPAAKRIYGYFSLPILWDGKLVARINCKADRKTSILHINHLALEPSLKRREAFAIALGKELEAFLKFNNCNKIELHKTTPEDFKTVLENI